MNTRVSHIKILLILTIILVFVSVVNGNLSNNASYIYENPKIEKGTIGDENLNKKDDTKSNVTIKIYRKPKKVPGFDAIAMMVIINIIYILKTKRDKK